MDDKFYIKNIKGAWKMDSSQYGINPRFIYMNNEFDKYWEKIKNGDNFALVRWGDGERSIVRGIYVRAQEGWESHGDSKLRNDLIKCLNEEQDDFVQAISCPCCDSESYYWYMDKMKTKNRTFANIWVNGNWKRFKDSFEKLDREAIIIVNQNGKNKKYGRLKVKGRYYVDDSCVDFWEKNGEEFVSEIIKNHGKQKNLFYVVSAGPLAAPIIHRLYKNNPENTFIDFGSSIDYITHGKITRPYMDSEDESSKKLCWMPFDEKRFDIDVVLTMYRRPHVLKQQLEAIRNQSLKPKRIFLYKDGIDSYYYIGLKKEIIDEFDNFMEADKNYGVWKRFEFASNICESQFICLFDDDTIPGKQWLENCHMHFLQREGVYGTNGVIIKRNGAESSQHSKNVISVGWHSCNENATRVDYVGHSWFFNKNLLEKMKKLDCSHEFKYAGEDMALSFAAQREGIDTYVPPHPIENIQLWGSMPEYGLRYGIDEAAISISRENLSIMGKLIEKYEKEGFKLLYSSEEYDEILKTITDRRVELIEKDIEEIKRLSEDIYLYGAGKIAGIVRTYFENNGIRIAGNVISFKKRDDDRKYIAVSDFIKNDDNKVIFLALDELYHKEVLANLKNHNQIQIFPKNERPYNYDYLISYMEFQNGEA
ncbi:MAG: glycosyltransferase family 2 protein [Lachnospiraceae bacterium]|nr:glycosyltransferase family 2 protein [Lachnospiraceae bacterium]